MMKIKSPWSSPIINIIDAEELKNSETCTKSEHYYYGFPCHSVSLFSVKWFCGEVGCLLHAISNILLHFSPYFFLLFLLLTCTHNITLYCTTLHYMRRFIILISYTFVFFYSTSTRSWKRVFLKRVLRNMQSLVKT